MYVYRYNGCPSVRRYPAADSVTIHHQCDPDGHRFMQANDPKHTSKLVESFLSFNLVNNWWKTSPESPGLNPIENLWHELKEHLRREVKPRNKDELVDGIV